MRRLYIEDESLQQTMDEFQTAQHLVELLKGQGNTADVFDTTVFDALMKGLEVWDEIKQHDEIYCSTSLIPLLGLGSSLGSGMLFNNMMHLAIEENVTGKEIYILNRYKSIQWEELRKELVEGAFKQNKLFILNNDRTAFIQVDIPTLLQEL